MLQQTQVATVIPYYRASWHASRTLADLAAAPVEDVMALWSGLGYYARARNLHACAQDRDARARRQVSAQIPKRSPNCPASAAPPRTPSPPSASARTPILDGNVKRVLCRAFGIEGFPGSGAVEKRLWALAAELMPARHGATYNQAQMDLGATVCTRSKPRCETCPLADICVARATAAPPNCPNPSRASAIPQREATLLVLLDGKRAAGNPPAGRHLGRPAVAAGTAGGRRRKGEWVERRFACRVIAVSPAPTFDHAFSHFRLHITPLLLR
jgi:A/G-specific adenine glycosylase